MQHLQTDGALFAALNLNLQDGLQRLDVLFCKSNRLLVPKLGQQLADTVFA